MSEQIRVLLVDDDPLVRSGLAMMLGGDSGLSVVGQGADGEEALRLVAELGPDVVLMDIRMPVRDGLWAAEQILERTDPPKIIMLTTFDTDDLIVRALRLGANGFLLKDTPPARIVAAVQAVVAGEATLSPQVTAQLIAQVTAADSVTGNARQRAKALLAGLSERERDVALAIGEGLSNAEIAARLYLSVATVKAHVGRLFVKLEVENRVQIALLVHDAEAG